MISRRQLLKALAASGALISLPLESVTRVVTSARASTDAGELYSGFLLLASGAPTPSTVKYPMWGIPNVCGLGPTPANAPVREFPTHEEARAAARVTIYTPSKLPAGVMPAGAYSIGYDTGLDYAYSLDFRTQNGGALVSAATLWVQLEYPRPYPVYSEPSPHGELWPTKVDFLPTPGLEKQSAFGYDYYWIARNVFYQLSLKYGPQLAEARTIMSSLKPTS